MTAAIDSLTPDDLTGSSSPRIICFLCRQKFESAQLLTRHKQLSELHRRNLARQDEEVQQTKEKLRHRIAGFRRSLSDVQPAYCGTPADERLQQQKKLLESQLRQVLGEYGQAQEKIEASRQQQQAERVAGAGIAFMKGSEVHETRCGSLVLSAGAASWQGNKDVQEDRYILDISLDAPGGQRLVGFCVLDGHAGSLCVDALVEWLPRNLQKCLSSKSAPFTEESLKLAVAEACATTDSEFLANAREREVLDGSTAIICLMYPCLDASPKVPGLTRMLIANLGDSRAVLCRSAGGGRIVAARLSDDQKPDRADERKRIETNGGVVDMQGVWRVFTPGPATFGGRSVLWGLAVSRAFGDILMKEPQRYGCAGASGELVSAVPEIHIYDVKPSEDRFLVLACDGIWDVLEDDASVSVCAEHRSTDLAAKALVRRAFECGSDDNLTALVVAWQLDDAGSGGRRDDVSKRTRTE